MKRRWRARLAHPVHRIAEIETAVAAKTRGAPVIQKEQNLAPFCRLRARLGDPVHRIAEIETAVAAKTRGAPVIQKEQNLAPFCRFRYGVRVAPKMESIIRRSPGDYRALERSQRLRYVGQAVRIGFARECPPKQSAVDAVRANQPQQILL